MPINLINRLNEPQEIEFFFIGHVGLQFKIRRFFAVSVSSKSILWFAADIALFREYFFKKPEMTVQNFLIVCFYLFLFLLLLCSLCRCISNLFALQMLRQRRRTNGQNVKKVTRLRPIVWVLILRRSKFICIHFFRSYFMYIIIMSYYLKLLFALFVIIKCKWKQARWLNQVADERVLCSRYSKYEIILRPNRNKTKWVNAQQA